MCIFSIVPNVNKCYHKIKQVHLKHFMIWECTAFAELADGEETIETDVDTGRTGNSGDKGTVSVSGVATANNALAGGGAFAISYPVTLP